MSSKSGKFPNTYVLEPYIAHSVQMLPDQIGPDPFCASVATAPCLGINGICSRRPACIFYEMHESEAKVNTYTSIVEPTTYN